MAERSDLTLLGGMGPKRGGDLVLATGLSMKPFLENDSGDMNIHSEPYGFFIHFGIHITSEILIHITPGNDYPST